MYGAAESIKGIQLLSVGLACSAPTASPAAPGLTTPERHKFFTWRGDMDVHPTTAALEGLRIFIEATVDARLRQAGAIKADLGPRELRVAAGLDLVTAADRAGI